MDGLGYHKWHSNHFHYLPSWLLTLPNERTFHRFGLGNRKKNDWGSPRDTRTGRFNWAWSIYRLHKSLEKSIRFVILAIVVNSGLRRVDKFFYHCSHFDTLKSGHHSEFLKNSTDNCCKQKQLVSDSSRQLIIIALTRRVKKFWRVTSRRHRGTKIGIAE